MQPGTEAGEGRVRRWLWFVAIWAASAITTLVCVYGLKALVAFVG
jgi:hypothetical protein